MSGKRASSMKEAAFIHTSVFTQPVWSWPPELAERIPTFDELYVEDRPGELLGNPIQRMRDQLEESLGPVKLLLTGQRGSGKSWALKRLGEHLVQRFTVVPVSATDSAGTTLPDADVQDLLLLMAAALAREIWPVEPRMRQGVTLDAEATGRVSRWVGLLSQKGVPDAPGKLEGWSADVTAWVVKTTARMRSDEAIRRQLREVSADDMAEVVRTLLGVLRARGRDVTVLFDDVDKLDQASAHRIFLTQDTTLATLNCRMVITCPFSLHVDGVARASLGLRTPVTLRNVKVISPDSEVVPEEAVAYFRTVVGRVMEPHLVDDGAARMLARLSAGVPREFGQLLQRACLHAHYAGNTQVTTEAVALAEQEGRIDLIRASQSDVTRKALREIRVAKKLSTDEDRRLLDLNMVVEYVNGEPWYDVHPILAPTVDRWLTAAS